MEDEIDPYQWHDPDNICEGMNLGMINMEGRLSKLTFPALDAIPLNEREIVLDVGCGTGLIGLKAIETGSKFVYFIEQNIEMAHILRNVLPQILKPDQFKLINEDVELVKREWFDKGAPQIMTSELYGPTLFDEGYVSVVNSIKKLFPDIVCVPEKYTQSVYIADVDYKNQTIWPQSEEGQPTLPHYKFSHHSKGWNAREGEFECPDKKLLGEIYYDTETEKFNNSVTFTHKGEEKIIYIRSYVHSHGITDTHSIHGFYLPPTERRITYRTEISLDSKTLYRPMLIQVD